MRDRLFIKGLLSTLLLVVAGMGQTQTSTLSIAGSNVIGAELMPTMVELWLQQRGAMNIRRQWTAKHQLWVQAAVPGSAPASVRIDSRGSGSGFTALALGEADLVMSSRAINSAELDNLNFFGNMNDAQHQLILAMDGIAILVHPDNPTTDLTMNQLARIFSGQLTHWVQLQTPPQIPTDPADRIQVLTHTVESGTTAAFSEMVLNGQPLTNAADQFISGSALSRQITLTPQAIGFTSLAHIDNAKAIAIDNGGEPVAINKMTIATEEYPLSRRLYLYLPDPNNAVAQSLIEMIQSKAGQRMINTRSLVNLGLFATPIPMASYAPEEYRDLTSEAQRLSINFRFSDNASALSFAAEQDVNRVVDYIKDHANVISDVMVFGFADTAEASDVNRQILSVERADNVAKALVERGAAPTRVRGYGNNMQLSANDQAEADKNRRVEIWIKTHDGKGSRPYRRLKQ